MELREHVTERDAKDVVDMMQEVPTFRSATAPHEQIVLLPPYITFFLGTIRERRHRASLQPNYSLVAVGRRGLGPREQVEQRTQHALSEVQYSLVLPVRVVHVLMYMLHVVVGLKTSILRSIYYS